MEILLNGESHDINASHLDQALIELGYQQPAIATAVNGQFVPQDSRSQYVLNTGDRIEVLAPMQGG